MLKKSVILSKSEILYKKVYVKSGIKSQNVEFNISITIESNKLGFAANCNKIKQ